MKRAPDARSIAGPALPLRYGFRERERQRKREREMERERQTEREGERERERERDLRFGTSLWHTDKHGVLLIEN